MCVCDVGNYGDDDAEVGDNTDDDDYNNYDKKIMMLVLVMMLLMLMMIKLITQSNLVSQAAVAELCIHPITKQSTPKQTDPLGGKLMQHQRTMHEILLQALQPGNPSHGVGCGKGNNLTVSLLDSPY